MKGRVDNVAGVKIPKYEYVKDAGESKMDLTGLSAGGQQVTKCRDAYAKTLELLVNLASLQSAFLTLDVAIKTTNRRVNALENVVKPRVANTISYIKVRSHTLSLLPLSCSLPMNRFTLSELMWLFLVWHQCFMMTDCMSVDTRGRGMFRESWTNWSVRSSSG